MARNDGVDRTCARNMDVTDNDIGDAQAHNEREKEIYSNEGLIVTSNYLATNRDRRRCDRKVTPFFCVRRLILQYWVR